MAQKHITMSRHGVYYFQYWIPKHLKNETFSNKVFRFSLNTTNKREAIKQSHRLIIVLLGLEEKYSHNPNNFGTALVQMKDDLNKQIEDDDWQIEYSHGLDMMNKLDDIDVTSKHIGTREYLSQFNQYDMDCYELARVQESKPTANELLSICLDKYITEKRKKNTDKSLDKMMKIITVFIDLIGDKPSSHLMKEDAVAFKSLLLKLPKNKNKFKRYKNRSFKDILGMPIPQEDILSTASQCGYIKQVSAFLGWMFDNDFHKIATIQAPLRGVFNCGGDNSESVDAFGAEDLKRLFENDYYFRRNHKTPSMHWTPLLGLFTGARLNEICQLYKDDIKQEQGIWYIDINTNTSDKHVKRSWHKRKLPIHNELIKLGFLDYVEDLKTKRLFPELEYDEKSYYQKTISDWFRRTYKKNCDVGQKKDEKKVFHSFRHNLVTYLFNELDISQPKIARLVGHLPKDGSVTTGVYAKAIKLKEANIIIQSVKWNIDFSKIKKWHVSR